MFLSVTFLAADHDLSLDEQGSGHDWGENEIVSLTQAVAQCFGYTRKEIPVNAGRSGFTAFYDLPDDVVPPLRMLENRADGIRFEEFEIPLEDPNEKPRTGIRAYVGNRYQFRAV